ncbi:amino acid synthesis family protein [Pseudonocardia halophobica]|uniref:Amino acid synthesis n=1 Tax=Pseudonocardia halophobica TaxID=29401 RepID=A0A9W6L0E4_9PSEU|nr:amino acid synthesis family protein [Pseudonocardia halophobica]GLL10642.1 hypothetical protein GCM10017577_17820 [Pseudonocardia halophobica]
MRIRKIVTITEETRSEGFRDAERPVRIASAMAVIHNPMAGRFVQDLLPLVDEYADALGVLLPTRAIEALGRKADEVEAFGKGAIVGLDGEIEHASAIIHTMRFGTPFRRICADATTLLTACEKRSAAGSTLDIPLKHVREEKTRSHYLSHEVRIADAPRPDEILVVATVADGGRVHPRSGSLGNELR